MRWLRHQHFSAGSLYGLAHLRGRGPGDALVALAMVVGTDIIQRMVFAVVPPDALPVCSRVAVSSWPQAFLVGVCIVPAANCAR